MTSTSSERERRSSTMTSVVVPKIRRDQAPIGLDLLEQDEIETIANGGPNAPVSREILWKVYGLNGPVIHPSKSSTEDCKTSHRGNLNSFAGLGWKKRKKSEASSFESSITRSDDLPFVGLKNLGATCYMNCMLQCLFHNVRFRFEVLLIQCRKTRRSYTLVWVHQERNIRTFEDIYRFRHF